MAEQRESRPRPLHVSKSFTRMDDAPSDLSLRKRASTMQSAGITAVPEARGDFEGSDPLNEGRSDVFDNKDAEEIEVKEEPSSELKLPSTFEDLPIELRSMTERFLEGLLAKVHPAPLSADQLSQMFQDFYDRAASQISTHIASLVSKIGRIETASSRSSIKGRSRAGSGAKRNDSPASNSGGEMLTPSEVSDRRRARRLLDLKRVALEETVEKVVCERLYDRLWKHRSTDDDARDEKLRSRIAALSLVGIGLKELHMDSDVSTQEARQIAVEKEADIHAALEPARTALQSMDTQNYPSGKLQYLTACHKSIVETLSLFFPTSSSADEILPTLIYTLITTPPESINVVSNLCYIQRFRGADKIDGEAAYCLVNLEAAISFLENVDLSSLRADELPSGPPKTPSQPQTPVSEHPAPLMHHEPRPDISPIEKASAASPILSTPTVVAAARPAMHQRSLSSVMQAQAMKLEAGREGFLSTADKVYDGLNGTLENSFKFVFGRLKEAGSNVAALPKTLDDARRLINPQPASEDDDLLLSGRSTPSEDPLRLWPSDAKTLDLIAGRKQLRDRSADSTRSGGSGKRVAFAGEGTTPSSLAMSSKLPTPQESLSGAASFITSINPLNRFGVPSFPRFGRAVPPSPARSTAPVEQISPQDVGSTGALPVPLERSSSHASDAGDDLNAREALTTLKKIKPPKKRFLDAANASELRIGDIEELLLEYKRLAKAIGEAVAS